MQSAGLTIFKDKCWQLGCFMTADGRRGTSCAGSENCADQSSSNDSHVYI